jgi:DNA-binding response OmpR family regulator
MAPQEANTVHSLADGRIEIIPADGLVLIEGERAPAIHGIRFDVLRMLAERADTTVTMADACMEVWENHDPWVEACLRVHVSKVRKGLGEELGDVNAGAIQTKWGVGYRARTTLADTVAPKEGEDSAIHRIADERISVDTDGLTVSRDGYVVDDITPTEFRLLAELARRPDRIVNYHMLLGTVWGYVDQSVYVSGRVLMSTLRKKLGPELGDIKTGALRTHSVGYYAVSSLQS